MRRLVLVLMCGLVWVAAGVMSAAGDTQSPPMPLWAFGYPSLASGTVAPPATPPAAPAAPVQDFPRQAPGSKFTYTRAQLMNPYGPAEFFPDEHPAMPDIVAHGKQATKVTACSLCHRAHGKGQPENAPVSGLPVSYFIQQMNDFKNGLRKSSDPKKGNAAAMIAFAKGMSDQDIRDAAEYFAKITYSDWIKVKEVNEIPKMKYVNNLAEAEEGKEPIGKRVVELAEDQEAKDKFRSPHAGFLAYAPMGSIKKGQALVTTGGGGKTMACGSCHGADLHGIGPVPGLAGRSASYLVRQMYDMQTGSRNGEWTQLMKPVVAKLTNEDFVNISAYIASRP